VQDKQITNQPNISDILSVPAVGRIIALDVGTKRLGAAVSDEFQITVRPLATITRQSWKELLKKIILLTEEYDAVALVLGLPYNFDGTESEMSADVRRLHRNFLLSLKIPVFLQDERLSSRTAHERLYEKGYNLPEIIKMIDSEAATIILSDFLELKESLQKKHAQQKFS
jgi:putative holliday junction resolvase